MKIFGEEKPPLEEVLAHHGVKGQKWGVRKAASHPSNRQLNKTSRAHDRTKRKSATSSYYQSRNAQIDAARRDIQSGKVERDFAKAKAQRAIDRKKLGSREARKRFRDAKYTRKGTIIIAQQLKTGQETTQYLLGTAGGLAIGSLVNAAINTRGL